MRLSITVHKERGEARVKGKDGRLVSTQRSRFYVVLRDSAGHPMYRSPNIIGSSGKARRHAEDTFGPLTWKATNDLDNVYGEAFIDVTPVSH